MVNWRRTIRKHKSEQIFCKLYSKGRFKNLNSQFSISLIELTFIRSISVLLFIYAIKNDYGVNKAEFNI